MSPTGFTLLFVAALASQASAQLPLGGHLLNGAAQLPIGGNLLNGAAQLPMGGHLLNGAAQLPIGGHLLNGAAQLPVGGNLLNGAAQLPIGGHLLNGAAQLPIGDHLLNGAAQLPIGGHLLNGAAQLPVGPHLLKGAPHIVPPLASEENSGSSQAISLPAVHLLPTSSDHNGPHESIRQKLEKVKDLLPPGTEDFMKKQALKLAMDEGSRFAFAHPRETAEIVGIFNRAKNLVRTTTNRLQELERQNSAA